MIDEKKRKNEDAFVKDIQAQLDRARVIEEKHERLCKLIFADDDYYQDEGFDLVDCLIEKLVVDSVPKEHQHELFTVVHEGSNQYLSRLDHGWQEKVWHDYWIEYNDIHTSGTAASIVGRHALNQRDASMLARDRQISLVDDE
jgi:hypothetical protein